MMANGVELSRGNYRTRMYQKYVTQVRERTTTFDMAAALHWARPYRRYLRGWLPLTGNATILDAACGDGKLLACLRQQGFLDVHGVDLSLEQVALARQVLPSVVCEDVVKYLRSRAASFDCILALDLIEHLTRDEALEFLEAVRDSLRPGGALIIQTPNGVSLSVGAVYYSDMTHEVCYTPTSLGAFLRLAGFSDVEFRECDPVALGLRSGLRALAWKAIRMLRVVTSLVETGHHGGAVFTRVFLARAKVS